MRLLVVYACACLCAPGEDYHVKTERHVPASVEAVLSHVDANRNSWLGESDYEAIENENSLKKAGLALTGVEKRFASISLKEFKIVSSDRPAPAEPVAELEVRFEIAGRAADGDLLSITGDLLTSWRQHDGDWKLEKSDRANLSETSSRKPIFTDITEHAIGREAAWTGQLSKGVDHWRGVLDEASGIDVYGHNGVAVGDYNGDRLEDFYVAQPSGLPNRLFRNNGDGTWTEQSAAAKLDILDDTRMALFADFDNDGDQDMLAITATQPLLFVNDGRGAFSPVRESGLVIPDNAAGSLTSAALADYDRDGFLDVYICAYDLWTPGRKYNSPTPYHDARNGPPNYLFRNEGDGTWEDVTRRTGLMQNNDRFSFAAAWGDYDNDGDPDLYVANDFGRNNLYRNNGNGTFDDVAAAAGVEDIGAGMSAAWSDYDNDGDLDLYVGNMWSSAGQRLTGTQQFQDRISVDEARVSLRRHARGNSLFRNNGNGTFSDVTVRAGVAMGRWAWSSDFIDIDNDGRQDIYIQ
ncbi:MAG: FG-GAP repeat domain-containing protein, partial [Bryobacteraceae bacterium]